MKKRALYRVIVFYVIAVIVSNVFRFDLFNLQGVIDKLPIWAMLFYGPLQAVGVLLGALIVLHFMQMESKLDFSFFGASKKWSLILSAIPVILLVILGVNNNHQVNIHYYALIAGFSTLFYCYFEEIGWRGYLEQELKNVSELKRILIIAILWYFWHLLFLRNTDFVQNLIFFGWLLLGSWGLGKIVKLTKSIIATASFHMLINILLFNGFIKNGLNSTNKIIVLGMLIPIWIFVIIKFKKDKKLES